MANHGRIVVSFLLACLIPGIRSSPECFGRWTKVFSNSESGVTVFGDRSVLIQAATSGADVRVSFDNYTTSLQNLYPIKQELCGQALFHISKASYDKFQNDAYWWFVNLCTTGNFNMARYNVGDTTSRGDTEVMKAMEWFIRPSCDKSPIYRVNQRGTVLKGSVSDVVTAVKHGHNVRITTSSKSYTFPADNLAFDTTETEVAAQSLWHVSQEVASNHFKFQSNAYWWFTIWSTSAHRHTSRWTIGQHTSRGETKDSEATEWFADSCWRLAYRHDDAGNQLEGSLSDLLTAIDNGHRVRVLYKNNIISATQINIRAGHVSASLIDSVSKAGLSEFQSDVYWYWRIASTTGNVRTTRYKVGINTYVPGDSLNKESLSWFVDTRPWTKALEVNDNGVVTFGSKAVLTHAIRNGAEVRYKLDFPSNPADSYSVLEADNIAINGNDVGAMNVRSISLQNEGTTEVKFQDNPYWWFTITTTTGRIDMSRWTVGIHQSRGHTNDKVGTQWFVAE